MGPGAPDLSPGVSLPGLPHSPVSTDMPTAPFAGVPRRRGQFGALLACLPLLLAAKAPAGTPSVQFTSATGSAAEAAGTLVATLALSETSAVDVSVPFTLGGSATLGSDYTIPASPVVVPAGQLTRNLVITLLDEGLHEANETVQLTLGTPTNATLGTTVAHTATVTNDDAPPAVSFTKALQAANETAGQMTVVRMPARAP